MTCLAVDRSLRVVFLTNAGDFDDVEAAERPNDVGHRKMRAVCVPGQLLIEIEPRHFNERSMQLNDNTESKHRFKIVPNRLSTTFRETQNYEIYDFVVLCCVEKVYISSGPDF